MKRTPDFKYAGLRNPPRLAKYRRCKYFGHSRELMPREVEELQRHIDWLRGHQPLQGQRWRRAVV